MERPSAQKNGRNAEALEQKSSDWGVQPAGMDLERLQGRGSRIAEVKRDVAWESAYMTSVYSRHSIILG